MEQEHSKKIWWIVLIILGLLATAFWVFNWNALPPYSFNLFSGGSSQNELSSIEKDLNSTDVINLDSDLASLETEINAPK